ncbi:glycosyltransferase [Rhodococcus sp. BP-349]|uniref:glycosyltransferase n=1 Tax=unclassified Rhodococcus (in: high G+C Gram-positive bacteria) TaxID=192944 RepID=UPI001C9AB1B4|nr:MULTISPECIES: glycosyltransferase [unclassified Rhodococcus (in: high G+C Gram-positive bacteria)]MBY6539484.1 glycosyltransferase [Rhodococcus sp. BP-363]MBY6544188.1 glycosyltransferase [Rhodococcus sp. BP-369]MBY6563418.1 glycosyltransferase [Rhodococcus sp. BP-370]MBY6577710.1 glycosyltransferase [Rhodococcus sp. BP-364]MBY6587011.1 glycosyltransferase [Rhodococcus sp. BP-358]
MKILQVVTLVSLDGAFGGPATVASAQSTALRLHGHTVSVVAGAYDSVDDLHRALGPVTVFPVRRRRAGTPSSLVSWRLAWWVWRHRRRFDVVHVHLGRDGVSLPAALVVMLSGSVMVVQPHGMIAPDDRWAVRVVDVLAARPVLRHAGAVLHLTSRERADLVTVAGRSLPFVRVRNAVQGRPVRPVPQSRPVVLFVARLHPRKGVRTFVEAAKQLVRDGVEAEFLIVGPDAGEGDWVRNAVAAAPSIRWSGPVSPVDVESLMRTASVFVLPSVDEPFPMVVLEAMSVGVPVVITTECGLASTVREHVCGHVVEPTAEGVADGIRRLLDDPRDADRRGRNGHDAVLAHFSTSSLAEHLLRVYSTVRDARRPGWRTSRAAVGIQRIRTLLRRAP